MQILEESFPDDRVIIDADPQLLKHGIDISLELVFSSFMHCQDDSATFVNVPPYILQLLSTEKSSRAS